MRSTRFTIRLSSKNSNTGPFGGKPDPVAVILEVPKVVFGVKVMTGNGTTNGALAEFPVSSVALTV